MPSGDGFLCKGGQRGGKTLVQYDRVNATAFNCENVITSGDTLMDDNLGGIAVPFNGNKMMAMTGDRGKSSSKNVYVYDTETKIWELIGSIDKRLYQQTATCILLLCYIYGGVGYDDSGRNDEFVTLYEVNMEGKNVNVLDESGPSYTSIGGYIHAIGSFIYLFGGQSLVGGKYTHNEKVWRYDLVTKSGWEEHFHVGVHLYYPRVIWNGYKASIFFTYAPEGDHDDWHKIEMWETKPGHSFMFDVMHKEWKNTTKDYEGPQNLMWPGMAMDAKTGSICTFLGEDFTKFPTPDIIIDKIFCLE